MIQIRYLLYIILFNLLFSFSYSQNTKLIGTGILDGGTMYSVNIDGTDPQKLVDMRYGHSNDYQQPQLIEKEGKLYGVASKGVSSRYGVLFSIDLDGSNYNEIFKFSGSNGRQPNGGLSDINGRFYGTTQSGGTNGDGVVFSMNYNGTDYQIIHNFNSEIGDGAYPLGNMTVYNEMLWGTTLKGGVDDIGTIFKIDLSDDSYSQIFDFYPTTSKAPSGSLVHVNGELWGVTMGGGSMNFGTIYKLSLADTSYSKIHDFIDGRIPYGKLIFDQNYLWGTTTGGGTHNKGTVFKILSDGTSFEIVHNLTTIGDVRGSLIYQGGKFWGLAKETRLESFGGGVFSFENDGSNLRFHHQFEFENFNQGFTPTGTLCYFDGILYGMTDGGGTGGTGTIFKIDNDGSNFGQIHSFNETNGQFPYGALVNDGRKLFGVSRRGGIGYGLIYSIEYDGSDFTKLHQFQWQREVTPDDDLLLKNGHLYGSTGKKGSGGDNTGVIFKINLDGSGYTVLREFEADEDGAAITSIIGDKLFGRLLGSFYKGALFNINLDGTDFKIVHEFDGTDGNSLNGRLIQFNEKIWGIAVSGGDNNFGVIYTLDNNGENFKVVHHFDGINGSGPTSDLIEFKGELWGATSSGGVHNQGTIYKISADDNFNLVYNFTAENGIRPTSRLIANDSLLYGIGVGIDCVFEFNPTTQNFKKLAVLSSEFGGRPINAPLLVNIEKGEQIIIFESIESKSYGDDTFTLSATSNSVNPITFSSSDESIISIVDDQATILGAGEVTLFATQLESENHHAGQSEQTITIGKAQLMATAHDYEMVYGADLPDLDIDYTGFVNGDTELDIIEPTISTLASSQGDVGDYEVTLTGGLSSNYNISLNPGTITITKALLEVIANDKLMTYGSEIPVLDISYDGFLNDDTQLDITIPSISTSASSVSNVGTYEIILQEGSANNYDLSLNPGTLTVTKANLGVTAEDKAMVYGSSVPILALSYSGFLNDDTKLDIQEPTITTLASATSDVGDYEITLAGGSSINYNFLLNPGTLTITKALLEVTAHNYVMTYGSDIPELDINYDGFLNGDSDEDITVPSISTSASSTSDVGIYEITLQEGFASNYELNLNPGTLTITKANLEVTAEDKVMTYGSVVPSLDLSYSGFLNGDTEIDITKPTVTTFANSTSDVGDYEVTLTGGLSNNYDLSLNPGTLNISKAILVATPNNKTITYGDDIPELDISYSGFLNDDTELDITKPLASTLASSGSDAGNYELTLTGGSATNYELVLNTGVLAIEKAPQKITFADPGTINSDQSEIQLNAESNSGLEVIFESSNENILFISGNIGSVLNAGIVEILAKQPGNNNYMEADPVSRILTIEQVLGLGSMLEFNVYPNPFDSYFIVASPVNNGKIEDFAIFNSEGVSIPYESIDQGTQLIIKPKILVSGLYLTQFKVDGKSYYKRLVIK